MYFLPYSPVESHLSTPSDIFQDVVDPVEAHESWSVHTLAMADQMYADHFGRLSTSAQEWTPASAVSSFNLPLIYDSTLTTPLSPNYPDRPLPNGKHLNDPQWSRHEHPPMQYPVRGHEGIYSSMSMKSKNDPLNPSDGDGMLSISPFVFESPSTPTPPTPYWGSYGVSATPTTNAATSMPNPGATLHPSAGAAAAAVPSQAPILTAPTPAGRRPHQRAEDDHARKQKHHGHPGQVGLSLHHSQKAPSSGTQVKRECPSPSSDSKRRRRSAPPEQRKPLSKEELSEEDRLLLHLRDIKEEEKWDWKELTERFNKETGGKHNLAALQMRHTRLVERMRVWTDVEIRALNRAKIQFENQKWKTIAECMLEYGCETKWSPHACQQKWQELHPNEGVEYDGSGATWNDNVTIGTASPYRKDSTISRSEDLDDEAEEGGILEQQLLQQQQHQQLQMHQGDIRRSSGSGRGMGGKNIYGQRQDWTVQHTDPHLTSRSVQ